MIAFDRKGPQKARIPELHNSTFGTLEALVEGEWAWRVNQFADVTGLDIIVQPDRALFDRLPRVNAEAQKEREACWAVVSRTLQAVDRNAISTDERINLDVYRNQIDTLLERQQYREFEAPANSDTAFWSEVAAIGRRPFAHLDDYENWVAQLRDVPRYFKEQMDVMRRGVRRGFTPPKVSMRGRDHAIRSIVGARAEDTPFYIPYRTAARLNVKPGDGVRVPTLNAITECVQPAYAELLTFLREEYLPQCRDTVSAESLPNGKEYYRAKVRHHTTLDLTPEEIHAFGLSEVDLLRKEMRRILDEVKFGGSLPEFLEFLRTDARFYAKSGDELLMRAAWIAKKVDGVAGAYFGLLPRMRFTIRPVPDDIAPYYTAGRGTPGVYWLNTYRPEIRPLFSLPSLTLHESAPGHMLQMALTLENSGLSAFRRETYLAAYAEGWALYCERLGEEMGLYETPYERFGMLGYQVWRAARLVVDTGVHALGWRREQAIAYLADNTTLSPHEIASEVDRYISWPGQALSYYLGEDAISKARTYAEEALGAAFDIREFHDEVLSLGSVPLAVLRSAVEASVALRMEPRGHSGVSGDRRR